MSFLRSSLRLHAPALAAAAVAASSSSLVLASARLESSEVAPAPGVEFLGVFLDQDTTAALRAKYPSKFDAGDKAQSKSQQEEPLFLVLKFNPTAAEKEAFAPIMGRAAALRVQGYVEDDETQAVLVAVTTETGEPIDFPLGQDQEALPAHVTIASVNGQQGLNAGASSVLLERLRADGRLQWVLDTEAKTEEAPAPWTGELPAFESKRLALFNPFPATTATVRPVVDGEGPDSERLRGTVCVSSAFDPATGGCSSAAPKAECGFCKFMKAGPCGQAFTAWEACLDRCKRLGQDFIEHCGKETLALRDCVDANPEYYAVLNEPPEGDDDKPSDKPQEQEQ